MTILFTSEIYKFLAKLAPVSLQESYDNSGLIIDSGQNHCSGILLCLDVTTAVVQEAIDRNCNLIISHHPVIFSPIRKLSASNRSDQPIILAIKHGISIYAAHTNLDNIHNGVSAKMAEVLGLINPQVLAPMKGKLQKLSVMVPNDYAENVKEAAFNAGGGNIGNYSQCSFATSGIGTFKAEAGANPVVGEIGKREVAQEQNLDIITPSYLSSEVISAIKAAHPYEEVAYYIVNLDNEYQHFGSGIIAEAENELSPDQLLEKTVSKFWHKSNKAHRFPK